MGDHNVNVLVLVNDEKAMYHAPLDGQNCFYHSSIVLDALPIHIQNLFWIVAYMS